MKNNCWPHLVGNGITLEEQIETNVSVYFAPNTRMLLLVSWVWPQSPNQTPNYTPSIAFR